MIVVPAIDLREGACVQLRGGDYADELVRLDDPIGVARRWRSLGFEAVHLVDLDAATGRGDNAAVVASICAIEGLHVQVGGGVRDDAAIAALLDAGASSVIVATRAIEEPAWLAAACAARPEKISLAIDVRGGAVTTRGWTAQTALDPIEVVASLDGIALCQVLATAVDVEGRQRGPDLALVAALRGATSHRLAIAGGIASTDHLDSLRDLGVDAAVVGTALYTGALDPQALAKELHQ